MTQPGREIELKFTCEPADLPAVLAAAPPGADSSAELISVYFDTPDRALERAGVSLRVRESHGRRIQTLKRGKGLSREEHEQPVDGFKPDAHAPPLSEILTPDGVETLSPAFYVGVHRRQRLVHFDGAEIEIALDHGEVRATHGKSPISEVELELKSGEPAALFALARALAHAAPLYLSFDGKATVGQALTAGAKPQARRKEALVLKPRATAAEAFQAAARSALAHIAGNAQALRDGEAPDAVHQLRVAARRLRSLLSTFGPLVRDAGREGVATELKWLAGACNDTRDLDVFGETARAARKRLGTVPTGFAPLLARVEEARAKAAAGVHEAVTSERFRALLVEATAWVEIGPWTEDAGRAPLREALAIGFAAGRLEHRWKTLKKRGRDLDKVSDDVRHAARIEAKKLRYAAEAFESLFARKKTAAFIKDLKRLQDELGALNDAAVAERLAARLADDRETAFAAGELAGLAASTRPDRMKAAAAALTALEDRTPFWR